MIPQLPQPTQCARPALGTLRDVHYSLTWLSSPLVDLKFFLFRLLSSWRTWANTTWPKLTTMAHLARASAGAVGPQRAPPFFFLCFLFQEEAAEEMHPTREGRATRAM